MSKQSESVDRIVVDLLDVMENKKAHDFVAILLADSDRGRVLSATALLDYMLEDLLRHKMKELSDVSNEDLNFLFKKRPMPPLQSFGIKIVMARALGLITEEYRRILNEIQKVRNAYAHSMLAGRLTDSDVRELIKACGERGKKMRKTSNRPLIEWAQGILKDNPSYLDGLSFENADSPPRKLFMFAFVLAALYLLTFARQNINARNELQSVPESSTQA